MAESETEDKNAAGTDAGATSNDAGVTGPGNAGTSKEAPEVEKDAE